MNYTLIQHLFEIDFHPYNKYKLSLREFQIVAFLIHGYSTKSIAHFFNISPRTVDNHINKANEKFGASTRQSIIATISTSPAAPLVRLCFELLQLEQKFFAACGGDLSSHTLDAQTTSPHKEKVLMVRGKIPEVLEDYIQNLSLVEACVQSCSAPTAEDAAESAQRMIAFSGPTSFKKVRGILQPATWQVHLTHGEQKRTTTYTIAAHFTGVQIASIYYTCVLELVKFCCPEIVKQAPEALQELEVFVKKNNAPKMIGGYKSGFSKWHLIMSMAVTCGIVFSSIYFLKAKKKEAEEITLNVQTPLLMPDENHFIKRPTYIKEMQKALTVPSQNVKTVLLFGATGTGKSTIGRQYLKEYPADVTWYIDADTKTTLAICFSKLAEALGQHLADKELINSILNERDFEKRTARAVKYVREKLQQTKTSWLLFFDNVHDFKELDPFLPKNDGSWGKGRIILATTGVRTGQPIPPGKRITVNVLPQHQAKKLYQKIIKKSQCKNSAKADWNKVSAYLPPFPLEIAIAANFLRACPPKVPAFIESLQKPSPHYHSSKTVNTRRHLRQTILNSAFDYVHHKNPSFMPLLIALAYGYKQNLSRAYLMKFEGAIVTDNFIYALNKLALAQVDIENISTQLRVHKTVQDQLIWYLKALPDNHPALQKFTDTLTKAAYTAILEEDFDAMIELHMHILSLLKNKGRFPKNVYHTLRGMLGIIYYYFGLTESSRHMLERSVFYFQNAKENYGAWGLFVVYLGNYYRRAGDYDRAISLYKKSIDVLKQHKEKSASLARAYGYLGKTNEKKGQYADALANIDLAYSLFKKSPHDFVSNAWAAAQYGKLLYRQGKYKEAIEKYEESIENYKKAKKKVGLSWVYGRIGMAYTRLGYFDKAEAYLNAGIDISLKYFHDQHINHAKALFKKAVLYKARQRYAEAEKLFQKSFSIFAKVYDADNANMAEYYLELGELYLKMKKKQKARDVLLQALSIYVKHHHPNQRAAKVLIQGMDVV